MALQYQLLYMKDMEKIIGSKEQELNSAATLASQPVASHSLNFITIMTLGWGLFVGWAQKVAAKFGPHTQNHTKQQSKANGHILSFGDHPGRMIKPWPKWNAVNIDGVTGDVNSDVHTYHVNFLSCTSWSVPGLCFRNSQEIMYSRKPLDSLELSSK